MSYLHVIHYPNLKGDSCMVEQHAIKMPTDISVSVPNHPNYRLGSLPDYPGSCEPTGVEEEIVEEEKVIKLFPNPAADKFNLSFEEIESNGVVKVRNMIGQEVFNVDLTGKSSSISINTKDWNKGIYIVSLFKNGEEKTSEKLVVSKR